MKMLQDARYLMVTLGMAKDLPHDAMIITLFIVLAFVVTTGIVEIINAIKR
jgi:hypothetical protein